MVVDETMLVNGLRPIEVDCDADEFDEDVDDDDAEPLFEL